MALEVKHNFVSAIADSADATLVRPSNWNEDHVLTMSSGFILGRTTASTGAVEELSPAAVRTLLGLVIGTNVQAFSSILANTTASFTTDRSTKLAGLYTAGTSDVPVGDGGTGRSTATAYALLAGGTTATGAHQSLDGLGTSGQVLMSNGAGALPTFQDAAGGADWTRETAQATTSGNEVNFPGIPAGVSEIIVEFRGVSTSSSAGNVLVQLGDAGGIETSGYNSGSITGTVASSTSGLIVDMEASSVDAYGSMVLYRLENNNWTATHHMRLDTDKGCNGAGSKQLSAELTQLRLTTVFGNFDAGSVNIMYR